MNVLLVTFVLRNANRNYETFFVTLRGYALQWWHYIPQTVVVVTNLTIDELTDKLFPHCEPNDSFLITAIGPDVNGLLPLEAWDWINQVTGSRRTPTALSDYEEKQRAAALFPFKPPQVLPPKRGS
jgi:hypothetical protein